VTGPKRRPKDKPEADEEIVRPTVQGYVKACSRLDGFKGDPPDVIFGDGRQLAEDRSARDALLKQNGLAGAFSEDCLTKNFRFRPRG
jgi:hypothetical protein